MVGGPDTQEALKRFEVRLKGCTYSVDGGLKYSIQKELDLNQPIILDDNFAIKTKKLIILRGKEIFGLMKESYAKIEDMVNLIIIDMDTRVSIEKTLKISETKDNVDILAFCGWVAIKGSDDEYYLKCPCCQRCVPLSILKMLNTASQHSVKRTFNPLSFNYN